jgi:dCMP deaminase
MDLKEIYSLRQNFTIIAITGRTGSGCTEVADSLLKGFTDDRYLYPHPSEFKSDHNTYRKYRIVYNFAKENFKPFKVIYYKHILVYFILKYPFEELAAFLNCKDLQSEFKQSGLKTSFDFSGEIKLLKKNQEDFKNLHEIAKDLYEDTNEGYCKLYDFVESHEFLKLSKKIHDILMSVSIIKRNKALQIIGNNIRKCGNPYCWESGKLEHIYDIAEIINNLIKAYNHKNGTGSTKIAIDSL